MDTRGGETRDKGNTGLTVLPPPERCVPHRTPSNGEGGGRSGGLKGHGDRTGQEASRAAPILGAMAERGGREAMADLGTQETMAGQGTRETMVGQGTREAMAGPGTREAMAGQGTREAMAGQGTREAMAPAPTSVSSALRALLPPSKISLG